VNTLANSYGVGEPRPGRNAIDDSTIIIECLRPNAQIVFGRWSRFSSR
jgi:hypothetical protein